MPPQTRGRKTSKASKENIGVILKTKSKEAIGKVVKPRKALADKTNSASDENSSTEIVRQQNIVENGKAKKNLDKPLLDTKSRPRRERKLPNRYNENELLSNLSNIKESETSSVQHDVNTKPVKNDSILSSPFKTPQKDVDNSLIANRPKRVCRLPSKFDDHSISPNKFIPVGCHASTPIIQNKTSKPITTKAKVSSKIKSDKVASSKNQEQINPILQNKTSKPITTKAKDASKIKSDKVALSKNQEQIKETSKKSPLKKQTVISTRLASSDTNNNAKRRQLRGKKIDSKNEVQAVVEKPSTNKNTVGKKLLQNNFSFRVLEDKVKPAKRDSSHLDVYEFTYDPNEEPPPQKKKRKRAVKKNPPKPKKVVFKNNYDQNVSKALAALKNAVTKKTTEKQSERIESQVSNPVNGQVKQVSVPTTQINVNKPMVTNISKPTASIINPPVIKITPDVQSEVAPPQPKPNASTRVEDIEADFEPLMDHNDFNYSPVTSPNRGPSPLPNDTVHHRTNPHDPLNLQDNLSFFDDVPVASSSMNTSVRRPHASPWRVQFEQLPIKWHVNTYIKPNMTPAVESSFMNFNDSNKKKHVYTNLVPESNDALPEIVSNDQPNLKQTSIIDFIKEVVERSASKKKRALSVTPTKANSVFDDLSNMSVATKGDAYRTPNKTPRREAGANYWTPNKVQENKENTGTSEKNKKKVHTPKSLEKDKDGTFFGFDESEDQENVSPVKIDNPRVRALRPRARAVLQEINAQSCPSRAKVPLAAKSNVILSSDAVNKVYEEMKSATDAPVFPEKNANNDNDAVIAGDQTNLQDEDSQSVHLFEDIELVHHLKPLRKSYGKAKKVTFQQTTASDSDSQSLDAPPPRDEESSEEDDLADLTFTMPNVAQKKVAKKKVAKKKKQQSKKEKAEMEAWAAQFNSMCEDVEEFPLVVE